MRKAIVLVVAAEPAVVRWTRGELMRAGYTVLTTSSLAGARERLCGEHCDLVIAIGIDRNDHDYALLEGDLNAPILSSADSWETCPQGALLDAVSSMLPRRFQKEGKALNYGDLVIELETGRVLERGNIVTLGGPEHRLLLALADHAGETMPVDELILLVWGAAYRGRHQLLRTTISRLRDQAGILAEIITTVPGQGYRLERPRSQAG